MMKERLQKLISGAGLASRRAAEALILAGRVRVNGDPASLGMSADPETDEITVDGAPLPRARESLYIMLHKPRGYVTTLSDERGRPTVAELVRDAGRRLYPVGRLDMYSEGLLLLTDDGAAANALMHPAHGVEKLYRVRVHGAPLEDAAARLRGPMALDGRPLQPARCRVLSGVGERGELEIGIREGRNRQVRRMCEQAGLRVERLVRVAEGELRLGALPPGKWRPLTEAELAYLRALAGRG